MNNNAKTYVRNYEKTTTFKRRGKSVTLASIIETAFPNYGTSDISLPDYLNGVCPWLYFNYIIRWKDIPESYLPTEYKNGENFGREVVKRWRKECWKKNFANVGMFNIFASCDELENYTDEILKGEIYNVDVPFERIEEMIYEKKQAEIDAKEAADAAKEEELKEDVELAKLENNIKELQNKQNELRQLKKNREAEQVRENNRKMATKDNSPWTADVSKLETNKPMAKKINKPASTSVADAMPKELKDGSMFDKDFMTKASSAFDALVMSVAAKVNNVYDYPTKMHLTCVVENPKDQRFIVTIYGFNSTEQNLNGDVIHFFSPSCEGSLYQALAWIDERQAEKEEAEKKQKEKDAIKEQMKKLQEQMQMLQNKMDEL